LRVRFDNTPFSTVLEEQAAARNGPGGKLAELRGSCGGIHEFLDFPGFVDVGTDSDRDDCSQSFVSKSDC
jgi:hypothetical protein